MKNRHAASLRSWHKFAIKACKDRPVFSSLWRPYWNDCSWAYRQPHMTSICLQALSRFKWAHHVSECVAMPVSEALAKLRLNWASKQVATCLHTLNIFWLLPCVYVHPTLFVFCVNAQVWGLTYVSHTAQHEDTVESTTTECPWK